MEEPELSDKHGHHEEAMPARWNRKRISGLLLAIVLSIWIPIAIDQGYFRFNAYILPAVGLIAVAAYLGIAITSPRVEGWLRGVHVRLSASSPVFYMLVVATSGGLLFCGLGVAEWFSIRASQQHVAELRRSESAQTQIPKLLASSSLPKDDGKPDPGLTHTEKRSTERRPSPSGSAPVAGNNSGSTGTVNQAPCSVFQNGGSGNTATGGNCTVLPRATITARDTTQNYSTPNGQFVSLHEVIVSGAVIPRLTATVRAASVISISLVPQRPGFYTHEPVVDGTNSSTVENASGMLTLTVILGRPDETVEFKFTCEGAECVVNYVPLTKRP